MDGVLLIGPGNFTTVSHDDVDPNFLLMGWDQGRRPTSNWTDGMYYGNGGSGLTRWFSTDVKLMLSRFVDIWHDTTRFTQSSDTHPWDLGWTVDADPAGNGTNAYSINGTFSGASTTFSHHDNSANNWMHVATTLCNNASVVDKFIMQPWTWNDAVRDWPTEQNTTFRGTFSDQRASLTWSGNYWAGFNSIDYGVPFTKDGYPQGHFSVRFEGVIDEFNSDRLAPRPNTTEFPQSLGVGGPDWVDTQGDREDNLPVRRLYYGAAAVARGSWWISAGAAMFALALVL